MNVQENRSRRTQKVLVHCARSMACVSSVHNRRVDLTLYTERSLLMATSGDIVCLHHRPDPDYLLYLNQLGIGPHLADCIVCPDLDADSKLPLPEKLAANRACWQQFCERLAGAEEILLDTYITTRFEQEFADRLQACLPGIVALTGGPCEVVEQFDQKHRVREAALELGVPVAPGEVSEVNCAADWFGLASAIRRHMVHTGKVIVRGTSGNSGSSVHLINDAQEVVRGLERIEQSDPNTIFLVEALVEVTSSPNIGMRIDPATREIDCVSCTEQVLAAGLSHAGNRYPISSAERLPAMLRAADRFSRFLSDRGLIGHIGFDFCVHDSPIAGPGYLLAEINPRLNGATYFQTLYEALGQIQATHGRPPLGAFHSVTMPTQIDNFAALRRELGDLLYVPGCEQGVVPLNLGFLAQGKCCLSMVGRHSHGLCELHERLKSLLQPSLLRRAA